MKSFSTLATTRRSTAFGMVIAVLAFVAALLARVAMDSALPPGFPFLTFFPAVIVTAFLGGTLAAVVCAVFCGLAAWYWFIPGQGFALDAQTGVALLFYIFIVTVDIALIHATRVAMQRLEAEKAVSTALAQQQGTMFEELQHRVANNMAFVASLLNMSRRRIANNPGSASIVIDEARARIETMARIHRRLHDPNSVNIPVRAYLEALCQDVVSLSGVETVSCVVTTPDMTLDIRKLTTISLLVSEVVTNSLKHAFPDGRPGKVFVVLERLGDDRLALSVSDDGVGIKPSPEPARGHGLGIRIITALVAQLHGKFTQTSVAGTTTRVEFPV